jgi:hypothetical protein
MSGQLNLMYFPIRMTGSGSRLRTRVFSYTHDLGTFRRSARGQRLGRPRVLVDAHRIALLRQRGAAWPKIAKQLGIGVGTAYRACPKLSRKPEFETLSTNLAPDTASAS